MRRRTRIGILVVATLGSIAGVFLHAPIPQSLDYHHFADRRALLGIPNSLDVLSNGAFLIVGLLGLAFLLRSEATGAGKPFIIRSERWPYVIFFIGVTLTAFGSAYYHLAPDNGRLMWDRLPMTIGFMAFLAAMIAERIDVKLGLGLLIPLAAIGVASVFYWEWTELHGAGDLRAYGLVQFYPVVAIVLLFALFPPRYTGSEILLGAAGFYALAKLFEHFDAQVFAITRIFSGHTLKHLSAGLATYMILQMLKKRRPAIDASAGSRGIV